MRLLLLMLAMTGAACTREVPPPVPAPLNSPRVRLEDPELMHPRLFNEFVPSLHGFQFRNGFNASFFGAEASGFGLCGGMSFAAADYYLAGLEPPRDSKAPEQGTPLFDYLYARQAASFGTLGAMGVKFAEWMQLPDEGDDSTRSRTLEELKHIRKMLDRGEPVVLGLVLVRAGGKVWDNHQVLAYAIDGDRIRVYDSNFPLRNDVTIAITEDGPFVMDIPGRGRIPIRGFFRMAYTRATPPKLAG